MEYKLDHACVTGWHFNYRVYIKFNEEGDFVDVCIEANDHTSLVI